MWVLRKRAWRAGQNEAWRVGQKRRENLRGNERQILKLVLRNPSTDDNTLEFEIMDGTLYILEFSSYTRQCEAGRINFANSGDIRRRHIYSFGLEP